ncbi:MAG TPA: hypothetical protein VHN13_23400 [Candidatus Tectomicrobia bacterium]|nr:hypothetical protein [Candidatus Tectomicrobia bacterium]
MAQQQSFARRRGEALEPVLQRGIFAGFGASTVMGFFALVASATYGGRGFFTPAYHVSFIIDPITMGLSLQKAGSGDRFFFSHESFIFGVVAHLMVGAVFGALFALLARQFRLRDTRAVWAGLIYGLAVMVLMSVLVLPLAANMSGAGQAISRMGGEIGWPTWAALHAIFGLALGAWVYVRPQDVEG